jgi:hypothetical protein
VMAVLADNRYRFCCCNPVVHVDVSLSLRKFEFHVLSVIVDGSLAQRNSVILICVPQQHPLQRGLFLWQPILLLRIVFSGHEAWNTAN